MTRPERAGARAIALLLIFAMTASARGKSPTEKLLTAPIDSVVWVQLKSSERLTGRLASTETEFYVLRIAVADSVIEREVKYSDTKSVAIEKGPKTESLKQASANSAVRTLTVLGVLFGVGALIGAINH